MAGGRRWQTGPPAMGGLQPRRRGRAASSPVRAPVNARIAAAGARLWRKSRGGTAIANAHGRAGGFGVVLVVSPDSGASPTRGAGGVAGFRVLTHTGLRSCSRRRILACWRLATPITPPPGLPGRSPPGPAGPGAWARRSRGCFVRVIMLWHARAGSRRYGATPRSALSSAVRVRKVFSSAVPLPCWMVAEKSDRHVWLSETFSTTTSVIR